MAINFGAQLRGTWDEAKGFLVAELTLLQAQLAPLFDFAHGLQSPTPATSILVTDGTGTASLQSALPCPLAFQTTARISPAPITSSTNNYNPPGWAAAALVRITATGAVNLTGATAVLNTGLKLLVNIGSNTITLTNADTNSNAANRWRCAGGSSVSLTAGRSVWIWYDLTSAVWQVVA
jgi:hypothetical protein